MNTTNSWTSFGPTLFTSNVTEPAGADAGRRDGELLERDRDAVPPLPVLPVLPVVAALLVSPLAELLSSELHAGTSPIASAIAPATTNRRFLTMPSMTPSSGASPSAPPCRAYWVLHPLRRKGPNPCL